MSYVPYVGKGLNNFEDTVEAFIHFNKGGYLVKKIELNNMKIIDILQNLKN